MTLWAANAEKQVDDEHANTQKCGFERSKVIILQIASLLFLNPSLRQTSPSLPVLSIRARLAAITGVVLAPMRPARRGYFRIRITPEGLYCALALPCLRFSDSCVTGSQCWFARDPGNALPGPVCSAPAVVSQTEGHKG